MPFRFSVSDLKLANSSLILHPYVYSSKDITEMRTSSHIPQIQESSQISSNFTKYFQKGPTDKFSNLAMFWLLDCFIMHLIPLKMFYWRVPWKVEFTLPHNQTRLNATKRIVFGINIATLETSKWMSYSPLPS